MTTYLTHSKRSLLSKKFESKYVNIGIHEDSALLCTYVSAKLSSNFVRRNIFLSCKHISRKYFSKDLRKYFGRYFWYIFWQIFSINFCKYFWQLFYKKFPNFKKCSYAFRQIFSAKYFSFFFKSNIFEKKEESI